jgi:cell wall-associated NlpC family hydrolase
VAEPIYMQGIHAAARRRAARVGVAITVVAGILLGTSGTAFAAHASAGWGRPAQARPAARFGQVRPLPASKTAGAVALAFALSQVGKPYLYGGSGPASYDCSGLAMVAWAKAGVSLNHYTGDQVHEGTPVSRANLRPGDLVFFGDPSNVYHVGLYVSADNGGLMVDAPHTGAFVRVEQIWWSDYYQAVRPA